MDTIDSRLKYLREQKREDLSELEASGRFAVEVAEVPSPWFKVLVQFTGNIEELEEKGFETRTVAGDIASGRLTLDKLDEIVALDSVVKIESSRPMISELNVSVPEIRANLVHTGPPGFRGSGVIIGIIDTGIDFTHKSFLKPDGTSRILALWDQHLRTQGSETKPTGYNYGVEYTKTNIDMALSTADPSSVVRHKDYDPHGHGTHVAGIAAGDGSVAGNNKPPFTYVGVAPEAAIIVVANRVREKAIGDSANTLDAVKYVFDKGASLKKPVVINLSQGDNLGPHDGTSLLERGIDNLLGGPGKSLVKSAGNAANDDIHVSGTLSAGGSEMVQFVVPASDTLPDTIDIWYSGQDRFGINITVPGGNESAVVNPGTTKTLNLPNGNSAFIDSVLNDPNNHDNRMYIHLSKGALPAIEQGTWAFTLHGTTVMNGRFDAWIERGVIIPRFVGSHLNNDRTISVPGTSNEVISAASYITSGAGVGDISTFSSRGPTRDGRQKPEIAAPGQSITSAKAEGSGNDQYRSLGGTSMAAPHIAGTIALMLQKKRSLTQTQIKNYFTRNARSDVFTGAIPNNEWGYGKVDAKATFDSVRANDTLSIGTTPISGKIGDTITFTGILHLEGVGPVQGVTVNLMLDDVGKVGYATTGPNGEYVIRWKADRTGTLPFYAIQPSFHISSEYFYLSISA